MGHGASNIRIAQLHQKCNIKFIVDRVRVYYVYIDDGISLCVENPLRCGHATRYICGEQNTIYNTYRLLSYVIVAMYFMFGASRCVRAVHFAK